MVKPCVGEQENLSSVWELSMESGCLQEGMKKVIS